MSDQPPRIIRLESELSLRAWRMCSNGNTFTKEGAIKLIVRAIRKLRNQFNYGRDPVRTAREMGVSLGQNCRLLCHYSAFGSEPFLVTLGDHVTVTGGVQFITHDGGVWVFREQHPEIDVFGAIKVGSNVFIGYRTIIMPGVTIGDNCVIGAGSVVTKDVPSNSVVAGVPARFIRSVDDYWVSVEDKGTLFRSLPMEQKRPRILRHLGLID